MAIIWCSLAVRSPFVLDHFKGKTFLSSVQRTKLFFLFKKLNTTLSSGSCCKPNFVGHSCFILFNFIFL